MLKVKKILKNVAVFALGAITCLGFCTAGFRDWSGLKKQVQESYNGLLASVKSEDGLSLLVASAEEGGASTVAQSSYTITATVTGEGKFNDELNWSIYFADSSSAWATGKNVEDYVKLTKSASTHSVTVENLDAFGEPILVKATSKDNSSLTATCQLDYLKRLFDLEYEMASEGPLHGGLIVRDTEEAAYSVAHSVWGTLPLGEGTIMPDFQISGHLREDFSSLPVLSALKTKYPSITMTAIEVDIAGEIGEVIYEGEPYDYGQFGELDYTFDCSVWVLYEDFGLPTLDGLREDFTELADFSSWKLRIDVAAVYNGEVYDTCVGDVTTYMCTCENLTPRATGVTLDKSNFAF